MDPVPPPWLIPPLSGPGPTNRRIGEKENNMSLLEGGIYTLYTSFFSLVMWQSNIIIGEQYLINYLTTTTGYIISNTQVIAPDIHEFFG